MSRYIFILMFFSAANAMSQDSIAVHTPLQSATDSMDYFFGINMGYSLGNNPYIHNKELVLEGFISAIQGNSKYDIQASNTILRELIQEMANNSPPQQSPASRINLEKGRAFLSENAKKEGVLTTASGLQYEIIKQGSGPQPAANSSVEVHYEGTLIDGSQFDSSYERDESISFPLNRVIKGWTEGLQLMKTGSVYKFYIPSELAYGSQTKGSIPPNSVLIFKIELLGVK